MTKDPGMKYFAYLFYIIPAFLIFNNIMNYDKELLIASLIFVMFGFIISNIYLLSIILFTDYVFIEGGLLAYYVLTGMFSVFAFLTRLASSESFKYAIISLLFSSGKSIRFLSCFYSYKKNLIYINSVKEAAYYFLKKKNKEQFDSLLKDSGLSNNDIGTISKIMSNSNIFKTTQKDWKTFKPTL